MDVSIAQIKVRLQQFGLELIDEAGIESTLFPIWVAEVEDVLEEKGVEYASLVERKQRIANGLLIDWCCLQLIPTTISVDGANGLVKWGAMKAPELSFVTDFFKASIRDKKERLGIVKGSGDVVLTKGVELCDARVRNGSLL